MRSPMAVSSQTARVFGRAARRAASTLALAGAIALGVVGPTTSSAQADVTCDKVASKSGSDAGPGTPSSPYRTPQKLVDSLSAGQTGCLREGVYAETSKLRITKGGSPGGPIILRSYPGERAEIVAQVAIANSANHIVLTDLVLNGEGAPPCNTSVSSTCTILPSVVLNGDDVTISDSEITNHDKAICVNAGTNTAERAVRLTMQGNRIHHCGQLPATNHHHGIYLGRTDDAKITDNLIYSNADRGIQLYPEANNSYVARNVIDGNGAGFDFSGASGDASSYNLVEHNLITNSKQFNAYSWYPADNPVGVGNVLRSNCISGAGFADIKEPTLGFTAKNNLFVAPKYADRGSRNFDLPSDDPCRSVLAGHDPHGSDGASGGSGGDPSDGSSTGSGTVGGGDTGTIGDPGTVDTEITEKPGKKTRKRQATFSFEATLSSPSRSNSSTVSSVGFECRLDRRQWRQCASPTSYRVANGRHRFEVRAADMTVGVRDQSPAKRAWKVKGRRR